MRSLMSASRMRLEVAKTRSEFVAEPRKQQPNSLRKLRPSDRSKAGWQSRTSHSAISVPTVRRVHFVSDILAGPPLPVAVPTASRPQDAQKLVPRVHRLSTTTFAVSPRPYRRV